MTENKTWFFWVRLLLKSDWVKKNVKNIWSMATALDKKYRNAKIDDRIIRPQSISVLYDDFFCLIVQKSTLELWSGLGVVRIPFVNVRLVPGLNNNTVVCPVWLKFWCEPSFKFPFGKLSKVSWPTVSLPPSPVVAKNPCRTDLSNSLTSQGGH